MSWRIFILAFLLGTPWRVCATDSDTIYRNVKVSLLTCAPGQALYSLYGHNALRIQDEEAGSDLVFNYGTFDFNTPHFAIKFMRGKLPYLLSVSSYAEFLNEYQYFQRAVTEQQLELTGPEKGEILNYLAWNMRPENRAYAYDFFFDNCATRLRDILDKAVPGLEWQEDKGKSSTYRQLIKEYQGQWPWTDLGIDLIIGAKADQPADVRARAFIPDYLAKAVSAAHREGHPELEIQYNKKQILDFPPVASQEPVWFNPQVIFCILFLLELGLYFGLVLPGSKRIVLGYDRLWWGLSAFASLLICFMWWGTDHGATKDNWNLLWLNPICLLLPWMHRMNNKTISLVNGIFTLCLALAVLNAIPGCQVLTQFFNSAIIWIAGISILKWVRFCKK